MFSALNWATAILSISDIILNDPTYQVERNGHIPQAGFQLDSVKFKLDFVLKP